MSHLRRVPPLLLSLIILYSLLAGAYFRVVPPLEGFDALAHFDYVNYLHAERTLPTLEPQALDYSYQTVQQPPLYYAAAALLTAPLARDEASNLTARSENSYFGVQSQRWSVSLPDLPAEFVWSVRLARLLSVLGGLAVLLGVWFWVLALRPGDHHLAAATTALVVLNPLFLFLAVTVSNETWSIAGAVVALWLVTAAAKRAGTPSLQWLGIGAVVGLATLTKYSVLLVGIPILAVLILEMGPNRWRQMLRATLLIGVGAFATAGFWYGRNFLLYGEVVPFDALSNLVGSFARATPLSWEEVWARLPWLFHSYWGVFVSVIAPPAYYLVWRWIALIGVAGLALYLLRRRHTADWRLLAYCLLWFGVVTISLINWMRLVSFGMQARLLHIGAPALALLLVLGWREWAPRRRQPQLLGLLTVLPAVVALWPLVILHDAYALPPGLERDRAIQREVDATFQGGPRLLGFDLPQGAALTPDGELPLVLYFDSEQVIDQDYTLFIHLVDEADNLLYQEDNVPFQGRHPTRQWRTHSPFADRYLIHVDELPQTDQLARLTVGFYAKDDPAARLPVTDAQDKETGDRVVLDEIRILSKPVAIAPLSRPALATWQGGIRLLATQSARGPQTDSLDVQVTWQAGSPLEQDYTVFAQLLDDDGQVVAQIDRQPGNGDVPTSTWIPGELIEDEYRFPAPHADWERMIIGFYDSASQERLLMRSAEEGDDYHVLLTRDAPTAYDWAP